MNESYSTDLPDFGDAFLCIAVEEGHENRRYLFFARLSEAKGLVSATFFTERERPAGTVMPKRHSVFSRVCTVTIESIYRKKPDIQVEHRLDIVYNDVRIKSESINNKHIGILCRSSTNSHDGRQETADFTVLFSKTVECGFPVA